MPVLDAAYGLHVIAERSENLGRFIGAYARLAKPPRPQLQPLGVADCVGRAASINLLRNAADASLTTGGAVAIGWQRDGGMIEIWVKDERQGLSSTANLFVPFFTTKPGGSGIGLVLSRQIAEGHGGALMLENRQDGPGCIARLRLPTQGDLEWNAATRLFRRYRLCEDQPVSVKIHHVELHHSVILPAKATGNLDSRQ